MSNSTMNPNPNMTGVNGKAPRKNLADQLDRLESVIDDLSSGLNETVVDVVRQAVTVAVQQAVQGLIQAVLQNPELLRSLVAQLAPAAPTEAQTASPTEAETEALKASVKKGLFGHVRGWVAGRLRWVGQGCSAAFHCVSNVLAAVHDRLWLVRRYRVQLLTAVVVGTGAGFAAFHAGPWLAAGVGWLGGFGAALAAQMGFALRHWTTALGGGIGLSGPAVSV